MDDAFVQLAKTLKEGNKKAKNGLTLYYATIQQLSLIHISEPTRP